MQNILKFTGIYAESQNLNSGTTRDGEQWNALDTIAERIRALGFPAPGTYKQFAKLTAIKEVEGVPKAQEMVSLLVNAHETVAKTARGIFPIVDEVNDQPSADLVTQRLEVHEKTAWMLRSLLG